MKFRKFGKTDFDISTVSFGVMQEASSAKQKSRDFGEEYQETLRYSINCGVNFIDLGYPDLYSNANAIAASTKQALSDGYSDKVKFNINLPMRRVKTIEDLDCILDEQLNFWGLEKVDFCTIHGLNRNTLVQIEELNIAAWLEKTLETGKVGFFGFSFHDAAFYIEQIIALSNVWSFFRIEYSLVDYKHHPGVGGLDMASKFDCGLIAAEPLKCGRLLAPTHENVEQAWEKACDGGISRLKCALRWVYHFSEVSTALLEFETLKTAEEQIQTALECDANILDAFDLLWVNKVREAYYADRFFQCTTCRCCMPCPKNVDAPRIIEIYHDVLMFGDEEIPSLYYKLEGHDKIKCVHCKECEHYCPKMYPISELISRMHAIAMSK